MQKEVKLGARVVGLVGWGILLIIFHKDLGNTLLATLLWWVVFGLIVSHINHKPKKMHLGVVDRELSEEKKVTILILKEYYDDPKVVRWCMKEWGWTTEEAQKIVQEIKPFNKL